MSFRWHAPTRQDHEKARRLIQETRSFLVEQTRLSTGIEPPGFKYLPDDTEPLRMFGVLWRGWNNGQLAAIYDALARASARNMAFILASRWASLLPTYHRKF